jgi:hypothetical protein
MGAPQRRRADRRRGRANSDAERRALAKASGRRTGPPPRAPRRGYAVLSTDGGSRGNPGPAAIGYVLAAPDGALLAAHGETIGVAGANVAEYCALLAGLKHACGLGLDRVDARCDAQLVVEQLAGSREPTNARLRDLCKARSKGLLLSPRERARGGARNRGPQRTKSSLPARAPVCACFVCSCGRRRVRGRRARRSSGAGAKLETRSSSTVSSRRASCTSCGPPDVASNNPCKRQGDQVVAPLSKGPGRCLVGLGIASNRSSPAWRRG